MKDTLETLKSVITPKGAGGSFSYGRNFVTGKMDPYVDGRSLNISLKIKLAFDGYVPTHSG